VSCVVCGLTVWSDDAIGLLPEIGFAHAECALVHMFASSNLKATEQPTGCSGRACARSHADDERWGAVLRDLLADDQ
jgi:hypothetical protein